jgi:hypothetical protein
MDAHELFITDFTHCHRLGRKGASSVAQVALGVFVVLLVIAYQ